jgi:hypothetical protein
MLHAMIGVKGTRGMRPFHFDSIEIALPTRWLLCNIVIAKGTDEPRGALLPTECIETYFKKGHLREWLESALPHNRKSNFRSNVIREQNLFMSTAVPRML